MTDEDLKKIGDVVDEKINNALEPVNKKLDALTADVSDLQKKAGVILDRTDLYYEDNKRDNNEIRHHLGLPETPSLTESTEFS